MQTKFYENLYRQGIICEASFEKIKIHKSSSLLSVHWELKTLLYLSILLLTGGLGILVYKNIDTIGHQFILLFIALICAGSFFYCFKKKLPFSFKKVEAPNTFFDYVLLLGCLSFISFTGYLQFQYNVFGNNYGLAAFIPMSVLFFVAYFFDHLGILSLAITNLAAWMGIAITPTRLLSDNDFNSTSIIYTGLLLGVILILAGVLSQQKKIKAHFEFTYSNFGTHILFISCLAGMFNFDSVYLLWFVGLVGICIFYYLKSVNEKSFYYLLLLSLYGYIGLSYVVIRLLFFTADSNFDGIFIALMYFIASAVGVCIFLITMNKKLKTK